MLYLPLVSELFRMFCRFKPDPRLEPFGPSGRPRIAAMGGSIALTIDSQAAPNKLTQRERVPSVAPPENKKRSMAAPFKGVDEVTIVSSPVEVYQILARSGGRKGSMSILALIISGMMAGEFPNFLLPCK